VTPLTQNNIAEIKSSINEMRNMLGGMNSRLEEAEEQISGLENRLMESNQAEHNQQRKKNYGKRK